MHSGAGVEALSVAWLPLLLCLSSQLIACVTDEGGHVAWCEGWLPLGHAWCDRVVCDYFEAVRGTAGSQEPQP